MKKINYELNENNQIVSYTLTPFDETKPYIEVEDLTQIKLGYSKVIDGVFYSHEGLYNLIKQLKSELKDNLKWLADNDWKPNKILTNEWTTDDVRWTDYLQERKVVRERNDYIIETLKENDYEFE